MSADPQKQSAFMTVLPHEIRDTIYLELWRSCGLRQHLVWHSKMGIRRESHFCRWPCSKKYRVEDELQEETEKFWQQHGMPLEGHMDDTPHGRRLQSPWLNHWQCGEHAESVHAGANVGWWTSPHDCWKKYRQSSPDRSCLTPYIPMLLSCKLISSACLSSIYASTTFVFTDLTALQMFFGYCQTPPLDEKRDLGLAPPAFFRFAREFELALPPDFMRYIPCAISPPSGGGQGQLFHDAFDFHWLRLDHFSNLWKIKIWIAARSVDPPWPDLKQGFVCFHQIDADALKKALLGFKNIDSLTLSTPLKEDIGSDDGYVDGLAHPGVKIWKRGTGDRFHPDLMSVSPFGPLSGSLYASATREVRLATNSDAEGQTYYMTLPWYDPVINDPIQLVEDQI